MTARVTMQVHLRGDDPFSAKPYLDGRAGPFVCIDAGDVGVYVTSPAQADSLIRAAVTAKDFLLAAAGNPIELVEATPANILMAIVENEARIDARPVTP